MPPEVLRAHAAQQDPEAAARLELLDLSRLDPVGHCLASEADRAEDAEGRRRAIARRPTFSAGVAAAAAAADPKARPPSVDWMRDPPQSREASAARPHAPSPREQQPRSARVGPPPDPAPPPARVPTDTGALPPWMQPQPHPAPSCAPGGSASSSAAAGPPPSLIAPPRGITHASAPPPPSDLTPPSTAAARPPPELSAPPGLGPVPLSAGLPNVPTQHPPTLAPDRKITRQNYSHNA